MTVTVHRNHNSPMPPDPEADPEEDPMAPPAQAQVVPPRAATIGKNTLVPIGSVIAAVVMTIGVMSYLSSDRDRIIVLETQNDQLKSLVADIAEDLKGVHGKLDVQTGTLAKLSELVAVVNSRLDKCEPIPVP